MAVFTFLGGTFSATSSWAGGVVPTAELSRLVFNSSSGDCVITSNISFVGWRFDGTTASTDNEFDTFPPATDYYTGTIDFTNKNLDSGGSAFPFYLSPSMKFKHGSSGRIGYFGKGRIRSNGLTHSYRFNFFDNIGFEDDFIADQSWGIDTLFTSFNSQTGNLGKSSASTFSSVKCQFNFGGVSQSSIAGTMNATIGVSILDGVELILGPHNGSVNPIFSGDSLQQLSVNNPTYNALIVDGGSGTYSRFTIGKQASTFREKYNWYSPKYLIWRSGNWEQDHRLKIGGNYDFFFVNETANKMIIKNAVVETSANSSVGPLNILGNVEIQHIAIEPGVSPNTGGYGRLIIGSGTSSLYPSTSNSGLSASSINFSSYGDINNNDISTAQLYIQRGGSVSVDYISSNFQFSNTLNEFRRHEINVNSTPASGATPSFNIRNDSNVIMNMNVLNVDLIGNGKLYGLTAISFTGSTGNFQEGLPTGGGGSTETSHTFIL